MDEDDNDGNSDTSITAHDAVNIGEHVALPVIIIFGLATNALCLKLLRNPVLKNTYIHKYITLLVSLDLLSFMFHIPRIFEHCPTSNYAFAVYMTKVNWVIILFLRTISIYILVFISYDRFLAIWKNEKFQYMKNNDPFKKRMIILLTWCLISTIPMIIIGQVKPHEGSEGNAWMIIPALKKKPDTIWGEIYGVYSGIFFLGLPLAFVIGLSIGLVLGIFLNKITDFNKERRRTQLRKVGSVLGLNISFGLLFMPYSAILLHYETKTDTCYRSVYEESVLFGLYCLVLIWSILNGIIYILLNKEYKDEFKNMLYSSWLFGKCLGKDSDEKLKVNYSTFSDSEKGVDVEEDGNKDSNNEPENTKKSSNMSLNHYTNEGIQLEKNDANKEDVTNDINDMLEKDNCIQDEQKSTSKTIDPENGVDTIEDANKAIKEPLEKDNCIQYESNSTEIPGVNSINLNTSEALDPEKESLEYDMCIEDEPETTQRSSDISHNITTSDVDEIDINQSSGHDYDVKKVKGTLQDAAKLYTSTASINFNK